MMFQYYGYGGRGIWQTLIDWGFVDAILPFLLIFVLIFAILQKIELFKDENNKPDRKINGIIGMVVAAMIVVPHVVGLYPQNTDPIVILMNFLPQSAALLVAVLMVMLLLGLAGGGIPSLMTWVVALAALAMLLFIILMAVVPGFFPTFQFLRDPGIQALIVVFLVMGLIGWLVMRPPGQEGGLKKFVEEWVK